MKIVWWFFPLYGGIFEITFSEVELTGRFSQHTCLWIHKNPSRKRVCSSKTLAEMFQFYFQIISNLTTEVNAAERISSANAGAQVVKTRWTATGKNALTEESISWFSRRFCFHSHSHISMIKYFFRCKYFRRKSCNSLFLDLLHCFHQSNQVKVLGIRVNGRGNLEPRELCK